jgi:hypothetical protein
MKTFDWLFSLFLNIPSVLQCGWWENLGEDRKMNHEYRSGLLKLRTPSQKMDRAGHLLRRK